MSRLTEQIKKETKKDPMEVLLIILAFFCLLMSLISPFFLYTSFFILILNGIETLEKRLDKQIELLERYEAVKRGVVP